MKDLKIRIFRRGVVGRVETVERTQVEPVGEPCRNLLHCGKLRTVASEDPTLSAKLFKMNELM
jgi:hypothetical protein